MGKVNTLELKDVTVDFCSLSGGRFRAIDNISLSIENGELVSVVGRSGCGKTTLLNIIAGLVKPTSGTIELNGKRIEKPGRDRGVVFQADAVFLWKRVAQNIDFALRLGGTPKVERPISIMKYLKLVKLDNFTNFYPKELSGGMRKRLAIAMVLANRPELLLMDEPFGPLDYATKIELQMELESIRQETPITTFFVTHDVEEATYVADRVIVMDKGKIIDEVKVDIPRPRTLESRKKKDFLDISGYLLNRLIALSDVKAEV